MKKSLLPFSFTLYLFFAICALLNAAADSRGCKNFYEMKPSNHFISLGVNGYQQTENWTCGPSAVMSLMNWYGKLSNEEMNHETEIKIAKNIGTTDTYGTRAADMAKWLNENGFDATVKTDGTVENLIESLKNKHPVIIEWVDWGGHWVVLTGCYEKTAGKVSIGDTFFFADPATHWISPKNENPNGISSFATDRFNEMWFDYPSERTFNKHVDGIYIIAVPKEHPPKELNL
jgi:predicted double-glycine peptidase